MESRNGETQRFIVVRGNPVLINQFSLNIGVIGYYGIKLKLVPFLGDKVLVLDLEKDEQYWTEDGRQLDLYKVFNYPTQSDELLTELCNESKRRFEALSGD